MARLRKLTLWAISREGRHDIGTAAAGLVAIYTALHRAGVL